MSLYEDVTAQRTHSVTYVYEEDMFLVIVPKGLCHVYVGERPYGTFQKRLFTCRVRAGESFKIEPEHGQPFSIFRWVETTQDKLRESYDQVTLKSSR